MKKLFAVFFSLSLLMGVMTSPGVSAEGEADPAGTLFFEFEDLAEAAGAGNIQTEANHRDALSVENASGKAYWATIDTTTDPSAALTVSVTAEQAGYYKCQYAVMKRTDKTNLSNITLTVNDVLVGDNDTFCKPLEDLSAYVDATDDEGTPILNEDGTPKQKCVYPWEYARMWLFEGKTSCYLNEGENTLQVDVSYLENALFGKWKFFADYIKFVPDNGTDITPEETLIEAEDMAAEKIVEVAGASGGKWIGTSNVKVTGEEGTPLLPIQARVNFTESRYYDFSYVATHWQNSVSEVSLYLGENKISSNKDDSDLGTNVQDRFTSASDDDPAGWTAKWNPMYEYTKKVWVDAGTYLLEFRVSTCESEEYAENVKYFIDYIDIKPSPDSMTKDAENNYTAEVCFASPVSGTAVMAAYNENKLVEMTVVEISAETQFMQLSLKTDQTVTKVKVFVWDGFTNFAPKIECKEFALSN